MRLRLFARFRRPLRQGPGRRARPWAWAAGRRGAAASGGAGHGRHRREDQPQASGAGAGPGDRLGTGPGDGHRLTRTMAPLREAAPPRRTAPPRESASPDTTHQPEAVAPREAAPFASPVKEARTRPGRPGRREATRRESGRQGPARAAVRVRPGTAAEAPSTREATRQARGRPAEAQPPWFEAANARRAAVGWRDCGPLEQVLCRDWDSGTLPPPEVVRSIDRLAELPPRVARILAAGLEAIFIGPGGVPDLDDMGRLRGVPLPSGRATWDACAGAYGERKIIVGTRPSATPDVVCHEVGHALDDLDGRGGVWQSDSDEFRSLYSRCLPHLVSDFHRQEAALGRREFFADAFAAIASSQRPALVDMLGGDTRVALDVMLYFNVRYGI